ncbi:MAG: hypothetical protein VW338_00255 [Rhodospirillaceae bacterium]
MSFLKNLFSSPDRIDQPTQVITPGYTVDARGGMTRTGPANEAFNTRFPRMLDDFDSLRGQLAPGFGALTESRVGAVRDAGAAGISNLRGDLARRKILGSSFASDALSRAELEVGKAVGEAKAQSFLEELEATSKILAQEYSTIIQAMQVNLQELGVSSQSVAALNNLALEAQNIYAQELAGQGNLFGTLTGLGLSAFGQGGAFGAEDPTTALLRELLAGGAGGGGSSSSVPWATI